MTETTIGIDISKATLDAHRLSDGAAAQFSNDKAGIRMQKAWLKGDDITLIIYEPTISRQGMFTCPKGGPFTATLRSLLKRVFHWSR
jgi:hypothetical protein